MKWTHVVAHDKSSAWIEAAVGDRVYSIECRKRCWQAVYMVGPDEYAVGEYASERYAKAVCRRHAGAWIKKMQRDLRA